MTSDFSIYTQDYLETGMLSRVSDTVDKREGSIIYDTTAPVSAEFATYYTNSACMYSIRRFKRSRS